MGPDTLKLTAIPAHSCGANGPNSPSSATSSVFTWRATGRIDCRAGRGCRAKRCHPLHQSPFGCRYDVRAGSRADPPDRRLPPGLLLEPATPTVSRRPLKEGQWQAVLTLPPVVRRTQLRHLPSDAPWPMHEPMEPRHHRNPNPVLMKRFLRSAESLVPGRRRAPCRSEGNRESLPCQPSSRFTS